MDIQEPVTLAYDPGIYSSFPDITKAEDGTLICIYREADTHHPLSSSLILLKSQDGISWSKSVFASASINLQGFVFNCPRIQNLNGRLVIVCDTKTSPSESYASWAIYCWRSDDNGQTWTEPQNTKIAGVVPDHIIPIGDKLVLGYHIIELVQMPFGKMQERLVQMMAESYDNGDTWRDRITIAADYYHDFCEGSIVDVDNRLVCYLRDNRDPLRPSHVVLSEDSGKTWGESNGIRIHGHRIVAVKKRHEPEEGLIIGTYRDTMDQSVNLFKDELGLSCPQPKLTVYKIEQETQSNLYDFGYSGWVEMEDGSLIVVYYIRHDKPQPMIRMARVNFTE